MTLLWVTRSALADLKFEELAGCDMSAYKQRHPLLSSFYRKRAISVVGTEQLKGAPRSHGIWNLHAENPHRGVTWYDEVEDVVFLLAYSPHDYEEFVNRFHEGSLKPTPFDYEDVAEHRRASAGLDDDFIAVVEKQAPDLVAQALDSPGAVIQQLLGGELPAAAVVEIALVADEQLEGDVFLVLRFADRLRARTLPSEVVSDLVPILLPEADFAELDWAPRSTPRELRVYPGDTTIRWRRP